jgi:hypothetical protein
MKSALILATLALLVFAWMFRYDMITVGSSNALVRLDRWTGNLYEYTGDGWLRADEPGKQ